MTQTPETVIRLRWIYVTILILGILGFATLFSGAYITPVKNSVGALRFHAYPNISYFNSPAGMQLVSISSKKGGCLRGDKNCFQTKSYGKPGDTITVQVNFKNTSHLEATGTTLSIIPHRSSPNTIMFTGGIAASNGPRSVDSAQLITPGHFSITYIGNSCKFYFRGEVYFADPQMLFQKGLLINSVKPMEEGLILAQFSIDQK